METVKKCFFLIFLLMPMVNKTIKLPSRFISYDCDMLSLYEYREIFLINYRHDSVCDIVWL